MRAAYYEQLDRVNDDLVEMTRLVGSAMNRATQALLDADLPLAEAVIDFDAKVDTLASDVEERCYELVALQQPVATDLRVVIGALRISSSLERMGDLAEHVAKQARMRFPKVAVPQELRATFAEMGALAEAIVSKTGSVIATKDVALCTDIAQHDEQMDRLHRELFTIVLSPSWKYGVEEAIDVTLLSRYLRALRRPRSLGVSPSGHDRDRRALRRRLAGRPSQQLAPPPLVSAIAVRDTTGMPAVSPLPSAARAEQPRRVAMLSIHTSPLDQPGTGDAGGMNVYVVETARRLAEAGTEVEIFTRGTSSQLPSNVELAPGVLVRHITAGPYEGLVKNDLPGQLCAVTAGVMRVEAARPEGWFDLIHSHYWLSGQVGWLASERWRVPLVHSMHTMAKVKNAELAEGDTPEPEIRIIGEEQVVEAASRLTANTSAEARELIDLYGANPGKVDVIHPGVDLQIFTPAPDNTSRERAGFADDEIVVLFVGRIQPLKAPDVLIRAIATLLSNRPDLRSRLRLVICGGPSGTGLDRPDSLVELSEEIGIRDRIDFRAPSSRTDLADLYRAADVTVVPSYSESFGLVAIESQACGTPVIASAVGGLPTAVGDGGILIDGHDPSDFARGHRAHRHHT